MESNSTSIQVTPRTPADEGLRTYMLGVYNYMAGGLILTGLMAYAVSTSATALQAIFATPLFWVVVLAPLAIVFMIGNSLETGKASTVQFLFWTYTGLMGSSLAFIFVEYTGSSIAGVFFITAGTFVAMSVFGYTTSKDLSAAGSFFFMGLVGMIAAAVVNALLASPALHFAISVIGVLVFAGLTAHDTQAIRALYVDCDSEEVRSKKAVFGALLLYLNFINLFLRLLALFGEKDD